MSRYFAFDDFIRPSISSSQVGFYSSVRNFEDGVESWSEEEEEKMEGKVICVDSRMSQGSFAIVLSLFLSTTTNFNNIP